jgi:hypothetical protein
MATTRIQWAMGKVNAAGAWIGEPTGFVGVPLKTGTGVYELTLENSLGVPECCPNVTPWYTPSSAAAPQTWPNAGLKSDGVTIVVNTFTNVAGVSTPTDGSFCITVERFMPT